MLLTATDVVNQAIQLIGNNQSLVTGTAPTFDNSPAGRAAQLLYQPTVNAVGRGFEFDFARNTVALAPTGNTPPPDWAFEYKYPGNGIQVWQIRPATLDDPNNPLPVNWVKANAIVNGTQAAVIQTDVADAIAIYNNAPDPSVWDALFLQAVVRLLASGMAMALAGKTSAAQAYLDSGAAFESLGEKRQG